jgi:hypothetical protein
MEGALGSRVLREVEEVSLEKVSENANAFVVADVRCSPWLS